MTDELVKQLRAVDHMSLEDCFCQSSLYDQAADRIETLTAERDKYESAWMTAEGKLADAEALIEAQAKDHASNNIRFAEAEHRAKTAEAERDRLRDALEHIAQWSEAYPTEVFPEPDFAQAASALASSGMSIDAVSASNMRHATKGVGKIARAALKGESHE